MRNFIIIFFSALLSACAAMSAYKDPVPTATTPANKPPIMTADALIKSMGRPNLTSTAPNGNKLYVYTTQSYQSYPSSPSFGTPVVAHAGGLPIVTAAPPSPPTDDVKAVKCTKTYEIDKENMVVDVKQEGACK